MNRINLPRLPASFVTAGAHAAGESSALEPLVAPRPRWNAAAGRFPAASLRATCGPVRRRSRRRRARRGLSILETMLAIAILGGTLAALGELVRTGVRAAGHAQDLTTAQMLCENKINEVVIGLEPLTGAQGVFPEDPDWAYSVVTEPVDQQGGLLAVICTVAKADDASPNPFTFQLIRWTVDPMMKYPLPEEETEEESAESGASGSSASAGGSDGS